MGPEICKVAEIGDLEAVKALVGSGADKEEKNYANQTP
jgi:hypothetical protein